MNDKEEADIDNKQEEEINEDEEKEIVYQKPQVKHKLKGKRGNNQGSKNKKNTIYKMNYSKTKIESLYAEKGLDKTHPFWCSEIAECLSNATFTPKRHGHFRSTGMYDV